MILILSLGIVPGCRKQVAQSSSNASPAPSLGPESIKLSERWEQERARLDKLSKSYPANQLNLLQSLIEKLPPEQLAGEFERVRSTTTSYQQMSDFDQNILQVFVIRSVQQRDRTRLVYLLSGHCPRFIATDSIELYLALSGMPNPLLILFDSYAEAEKDTARGEIIEALASVFRNLRREHADDREFVDRCKQWYLSDQSRLKVNPYYQPNSDFSESRDFLSTLHRERRRQFLQVSRGATVLTRQTNASRLETITSASQTATSVVLRE